jgi:hypothetical protein
VCSFGDDQVGAFALTPHEGAAIWARLEATAVLADAPPTPFPAPLQAAGFTNGFGGQGQLVPSTPAVADIRHQLNQVSYYELFFCYSLL